MTTMNEERAAGPTAMTDLPRRLRIKASMIALGERIAWGSDIAIMEEAADTIEALLAAAPAHPAERQEQGEVQRLREALECASAFINALKVPQSKGQAAIQILGATAVLQQIGAAIAASTGQEAAGHEH